MAVAALAAGLVTGTLARAAGPVSLPSDGSVAFLYSKGSGVGDCSQRDEAEVRDLIVGVVHQDPFVAAGQKGAFSLRVDVRAAPGGVRATFALFDAAGASLGVSQVEDSTCDGAHLKLAASIALLLQPKKPAAPPPCPPCPEPGCDQECRSAVRIALKDEVKREVRAEELPKLRDEAARDAKKAVPAPGSVRAAFGAGALFGFELAADPAPGFWLSGEARSERWSFAVEARGLFPTRALSLASGATVDVGAVSGLVSPCVRYRWLAGCALVELGGVWLTGASGAGNDGVLFGLGARARVDIPIAAGFEARLFGDVMGHLTGIAASGTDTTGAFTADAPRRVSVITGLGLTRVF
ncbi:MAG: hypothetical protein U0441_31615 [Polyangiaceae bacterium]